MSVVTSVTLTMSCCEDNWDPEEPNPVRYEAMNIWLEEQGFGPLTYLTQHYGGTKHPQSLTFGAGYNYFRQEEFISYLETIEWCYPENVVLIMQPEEGETIIWCPKASRRGELNAAWRREGNGR